MIFVEIRIGIPGVHTDSIAVRTFYRRGETIVRFRSIFTKLEVSEDVVSGSSPHFDRCLDGLDSFSPLEWLFFMQRSAGK